MEYWKLIKGFWELGRVLCDWIFGDKRREGERLMVFYRFNF